MLMFTTARFTIIVPTCSLVAIALARAAFRIQILALSP